jgi:hypothetical protein
VIVRGDLTEVGVSAVDVAVEYAAASVGVKTAVSEYEATPVGIHGQAAVYGEARVVATLSHPAISVPLLLKATVPGADTVAVIVSTAPYVGVGVLKAREVVVPILATLIVSADCVLNVGDGFALRLDAYELVSVGTQSVVRLIDPEVLGVQLHVAIHGEAVTRISVHPVMSAPPARKETCPEIVFKESDVI